MRVGALIGAAVLLLLAGCGPWPEVEILAEPAQAVSELETPVRAATAEGQGSAEPVFVLNPSTQRFHLPGCVWAGRIAPERRIEYAGDRETLIEVGYEPCHFCEP